MVHPLRATVSAVVTLREPPSKIGLLNHSLDITAEQLVTFTRLNPGTTRVAMSMEFVAESTASTPIDVAEALPFSRTTLSTACWRPWHKTGNQGKPDLRIWPSYMG